MEFHGEFSMEIHGIPWNSMEVFHTGCARIDFEQMVQRMQVVLTSKMDVKFQQEKNMHSHSLSTTTLN